MYRKRSRTSVPAPFQVQIEEVINPSRSQSSIQKGVVVTRKPNGSSRIKLHSDAINPAWRGSKRQGLSLPTSSAICASMWSAPVSALFDQTISF